MLFLPLSQMGNMGSTLPVGSSVPFPSARYFSESFRGQSHGFINQMFDGSILYLEYENNFIVIGWSWCHSRSS